jgi:hypothetical protein
VTRKLDVYEKILLRYNREGRAAQLVEADMAMERGALREHLQPEVERMGRHEAARRNVQARRLGRRLQRASALAIPASIPIFIPMEQAEIALGLRSQEGEGIRDYSAEATHRFVEGWMDDHPEWEDRGDARMRIEDAVSEAVWERVSRAIAETQLEAIASGIEDLINRVRRGAIETAAVSPPTRPWGIRAIVHTGFRGAWEETVGGYDGAELDPDAPLNASTILGVAVMIPSVYGDTSMRRRVDRAFDRYEPETGSSYELNKIADAAARRRTR